MRQVSSHAQLYSYEEVKRQVVDLNKSYSSCAEYFGLTERQFEALVYWYHLQRDRHRQFQRILDSVNEQNFIQDCHMLSKAEMAEKYDLSYHHIEYLQYYFHVELTQEDKNSIQRKALSNISPERKALTLQKRNKNMIEKYGSVEEAYRQRQQLIEQSMLEKYGVRNMAWVEGAQDRKRQTNLLKYGVEVSSQCSSVKDRSAQTRCQNYGTLEASYASGRRKQAEKCLQLYGVDNYLMSPQCRKAAIKYKKNSTVNSKFFDLLLSYGIILSEDDVEVYMDHFFYDFRVGRYLIEIDPYFTHCSNKLFESHGIVDKYYHQRKSQIAVRNGYRCIHVFDWMDKDTVIQKIMNDEFEFPISFTEPHKYIYDANRRVLVNNFYDGCVEIYDDGGNYIG